MISIKRLLSSRSQKSYHQGERKKTDAEETCDGTGQPHFDKLILRRNFNMLQQVHGMDAGTVNIELKGRGVPAYQFQVVHDCFRRPLGTIMIVHVSADPDLTLGRECAYSC